MQAIQYQRYGGPEVLELVERPIPAPAAGQLLIKVAAAALNPKDVLTRKGKFKLFTGSRFPRGVGQDVSGTVVALGKRVQGFVEGDSVYSMLNGWRGGAYAEYALVKADETAQVPQGVDLVEAAAVPLAALTALQALRDIGAAAPGKSLFINGASGGVGSFAVQLGRYFGCRVMASCGPDNLERVETLGADRVVNYHTSDIGQLPERFDIWFDVFGNRCFANSKALLDHHGVYISTVPNATTLRDDLSSRWLRRRGKRGRLVVVRSNHHDLVWLAERLAAGELRPVIDREYSLAQAAEAHAYLETKHARGKVLLRVQAEDRT